MKSIIMGNKLRMIRKHFGFNLNEMGKMLGISFSYLSDIERGQKNISLETLYRYANVLRSPGRVSDVMFYLECKTPICKMLLRDNYFKLGRRRSK